MHYLGELGETVVVHRNDRVSVEQVLDAAPDAIVISPGPCDPDRAGICLDLVRAAAGRLPMLGVCLGHQCLVHSFGGDIVRAERLMHGKTSMVTHDSGALYEGMSAAFEAGRYHSLCAELESLPDDLVITAQTARGEIMGVRHKKLPLHGVQFHPESVLTPEGDTLMANFMRLKTDA